MQDTKPLTLDQYVDMRAIQPDLKHSYPTLDSFRWFVRNHREELARAGALINITGRLRFHPELFQQAAIEIGRKAALSQVEGHRTGRPRKNATEAAK